MKRLICDVKRFIGERPIVIEGEVPYIDLPFFRDEQHQFKLHPCKNPNGIIKYYWEFRVDENTIIYVFPTENELNSDSSEWINTIMRFLDIPIDYSDDVWYILHDKDFEEYDAEEKQWRDGLYYDEEAQSIEQAQKYVFCDENLKIFKISHKEEGENRYGHLYTFQHDYEDLFFLSIDGDDNSWSKRWDRIKKIIQW